MFAPFPYGYEHDLSLITGDDLIDTRPPDNVHLAPEWASVTEALAGEPVFCSMLELPGCWKSPRQQIRSGTIDESLRASVIQGAQYIWEERHVSLLWRTEYDNEHVSGWSGSILCLGKPGQKGCKPLLFQNFQTPIRLWPNGVVQKHIRKNKFDKPSIKGGFFLPETILQSEILLKDSGSGPRPISDPMTLRGSRKTGEGGHRKEFTSPV